MLANRIGALFEVQFLSSRSVFEFSSRVFENSEFGELEVTVINGWEYFPATECARMLRYSDPMKAVQEHCKKAYQMLASPENYLIRESEVYRLIVGSKSPSAKRFEQWVFDEVLPSIRKTGRLKRRCDR